MLLLDRTELLMQLIEVIKARLDYHGDQCDQIRRFIGLWASS